MAFSTLLGALSLIVTQFQSISAFTAVTSRLNGLSEAMEKVHKTELSPVTVEENPELLAFDDVTLWSADGKRLLVDKLEMAMLPGEQWVVTGLEDEPKVALLRATAGIWERGSGRIVRPGLDQILFLPERPYLPPGILWDILVRTDNDQQTDRADVLAALERLDLTSAVNRIGGLDADEDWDDLLSIGEQHLLSVVRILLAQPTFVVLDRPGSALPSDQIQLILKMLQERGMGVLVLAKNGESHLHFDGHLAFGCDAKWTITRE
jgi:putative ATP-binding cassette transporter